jgi:hypothetical protein
MVGCLPVGFSTKKKSTEVLSLGLPELWVLMGASPAEHSTGFELTGKVVNFCLSVNVWNTF